VRVRPISPAALVEDLADRIAAVAGSGGVGVGLSVGGAPWARVAVDGAPATRPDAVADALVPALRLRGRPALRVSSEAYLRPASLRLERGRADPDAYYEDWFDLRALTREVLDPLAPDGSGRVLPTLWDPATDRATRDTYVDLPAGGVLLLSGALLLGAGLPLDLTVHLAMSAPALARHTPADLRWTLPAYDRYATEVDPAAFADVVVRVDDPRHPALVEPD
jgi:hypothetical protein